MWWVIWWWEFSKIQVGEASDISNTSDPLWKAHICGWNAAKQISGEIRGKTESDGPGVAEKPAAMRSCLEVMKFRPSTTQYEKLRPEETKWYSDNYWNIMTWHTSFQKMVWENCMFHMVFTKFFNYYHRVGEKPDSPRLLPAEVYTDTPNSETNRKLWNAYAQSRLVEVNELPVMWVLPIFLQSEAMIKRTRCVSTRNTPVKILVV